jgi:hypothetical protein
VGSELFSGEVHAVRPAPFRRRPAGCRGSEELARRRRNRPQPKIPRTTTTAPKSAVTSKAWARLSEVPKSAAARSVSCFGSSHSFCWSATAAAGCVSATGERSRTASLKTRWTSVAIFALLAPARKETRTRLPSGFPTLAVLLSTPSIAFRRASTGASRRAQPPRVSARRPTRKT